MDDSSRVHSVQRRRQLHGEVPYLAGSQRPAWAQGEAPLCARPYVAEELLLRVRHTLELDAESPRLTVEAAPGVRAAG